jgi:hypothetical protein
MYNTEKTKSNKRIQSKPNQISVEEGSRPINTLYSRLLAAGPMRESVRAPFLFADFFKSS